MEKHDKMIQRFAKIALLALTTLGLTVGMAQPGGGYGVVCLDDCPNKWACVTFEGGPWSHLPWCRAVRYSTTNICEETRWEQYNCEDQEEQPSVGWQLEVYPRPASTCAVESSCVPM